MGSTISKVLTFGLVGGSKKKAAPAAAAAAPVAAVPGLDKAAEAAKRAKEARRGMLGRGAEDRGQRTNVRDSLGARAESLGVPSSAEIQGNRRFKREGVQGASRRLLS